MFSFLFFLSMFFTIGEVSHAENAVYGNIAVFHGTNPVAIKVILPPFSGGVLRNDLVHFTSLPENLQSDANGCFCFDVNDDRFAFVHTYYYANKEIEFYNKIFSQLDLPRLHNLEINLSRNSDFPSTGYADTRAATVSYPRPALDVTLLAHEIGHFVHFNAVGTESFGSSQGTYSMDGIQMLGVIEGTANLLSAFFTGSTLINRYDGAGAAIEINNFVRFPDMLISQRDYLYQTSMLPSFKAQYPVVSKMGLNKVAAIDSDPDLSRYYGYPDAYLSSAVITQPVWLASTYYGSDTVVFLYIKTIAGLKSFSSYSDLANALLKNAKSVNNDLYQYLKVEFQLRGLTVIE